MGRGVITVQTETGKRDKPACDYDGACEFCTPTVALMSQDQTLLHKHSTCRLTAKDVKVRSFGKSSIYISFI